MSQHADTIRAIRKHAEHVLALLSDGQERPPAEVRPALEAVGRAAAAARAAATKAPRVGVVGGFSSGKTQLLGVLLGSADLFPVRETPSTGNVTVIHARSDPAVPETRAEGWEVEFLTREAMTECLRQFVKVARRRVESANLPPMVEQALRQISPDSPDAAERLRAWTKEAWAATADHPQVRYLLREMTAFVRALSGFGASLAGRRCPLPDNVPAAAGLELAAGATDVRQQRFDDLPPPLLPAAVPRGQAPTAEQLRDAFPLIRRVTVRVRVPIDVWDLTAAGPDGELVLLDFPGLGAIESGVRDEWLCLTELADAHAVLLLLDARRPGDSQVVDLARKIQERRAGQVLRDFVVVAPSRFDQLPLESQGRLAALEQLAAPAGSERLPEAKALAALDVLQQVVTAARSLTDRPDGVVFVSALVGLGELAAARPGLAMALPQTLAELPDRLTGPAQVRRLWAGLAARLDSPGLARWLSDYAHDGGLGRLRQLLVRRAGETGLREIATACRAAHGELRRRVAELPAPAADAPTARGDRVQEVQKALEGVARYYTSLSAEYSRRLPDLEVDYAGARRTVSGAVRDEVVLRVSGWGEWERLLRAAANNRIVVKPAAGGGVFRRAQAPLPTRTDDFLPRFTECLTEVEKTARDWLRAAVPALLARLSEPLLPYRDVLGPGLPPRGAAGDDDGALLEDLRRILHPEELADDVLAGAGLGPDVGSAFVPPESYFALVRAEPETHRVGRKFGWDPSLADVASRPDHVMQVERHHDALLGTLRDLLNGYVEEKTERLLLGVLRPSFDAAAQMVGELLDRPDLVRRLAEEPAAASSAPAPGGWAAVAAVPDPLAG